MSQRRKLRDPHGSMPTTDQWLPTTEAARALGVSPRTLKRYGNPTTGFLEPGVHWFSGPYANSPAIWDVPTCRMVLHRRGLAALAEVRPGDRLPLPVVLTAGVAQ